jgi:hypothetical protein
VTSESVRQSVTLSHLLGRVGSFLRLGTSNSTIADIVIAEVVFDGLGMRVGVVPAGVPHPIVPVGRAASGGGGGRARAHLA